MNTVIYIYIYIYMLKQIFDNTHKYMHIDKYLM